MTKKPQKKPSIFGIGLVSLDVVQKPGNPLITTSAGGTCGNVVSILSYLGWKSYAISRLNNDKASIEIKSDLKRSGVDLSYVSCEPVSHAPIIIQNLILKAGNKPIHRFSMKCPKCKSWLPSFKAVLNESVELINRSSQKSNVFFIDRLSRSALTLAKNASDNGALVFYEPSSKGDEKYLQEILKIAHVVKYSDQRFKSIPGLGNKGSSVFLEIKTLGEKGLKFRHKKNGIFSDWNSLPSITAKVLVDSCGSGDWCTAGIISKIGLNGASSALAASSGELIEALKYGQTLAAWNCGYEGARGGMYKYTSEEFLQNEKKILSGELASKKKGRAPQKITVEDFCTACE